MDAFRYGDVRFLHLYNCPYVTDSLLAMIALSAVQSSVQTFIHNVILFIDTSNNAGYNQAHWLIGTSYLPTIASNV